jgi:hypothetical protein
MAFLHEIKKTGHWFGWLEREHRHLPRPRLFLTDYQGTRYNRPYKDCKLEPTDFYPRSSNGAIVLNIDILNKNDSFAPALAHEYRHHWQTHMFGEPETYNRFGHLYEEVTYENYWDSVVSHLSQPTELDAIRFECSAHPNELSEYYLAVATGKVNLSYY